MNDNRLRATWQVSQLTRGAVYSTFYYSDPICWDNSHCPTGEACIRPTCVPTANGCPAPPPVSGAICTASGWAVNGNLYIGGTGAPAAAGAPVASPGSSQTVVVTGTTIISGNLVIQGSNSTPIIVQIQPNSSLDISGCLSVSGSTLRIVVDSSAPSGVNLTALTFAGYCDNNTRFDGVSVERQGAPSCEQGTATPVYRPTSIDVLLQFSQSQCSPSPGDATGTSAFQLWYLGPIAGGVIAIVAIIFVAVFLCRRRVVPSLRMQAETRRQFGDK